MTDAVIVLITAPEEEASRIQELLVKERLAACVNSLPAESFYSWKGKHERAGETLLILKTRKSALERIEKRIKEIHPYDVPEILAVPIVWGSKDCLEWLDKEVS